MVSGCRGLNVRCAALPQARRRGLVHRLVRERAAAAHHADAAGHVDVPGHDADLALAGA
jgi:hypothetical protein